MRQFTMNHFFLIIVKNWETKNNDLRIFDWIISKSHRSQDFSPHDDRKTFYPIIYEHWKSVLYSSTPTNIVRKFHFFSSMKIQREMLIDERFFDSFWKSSFQDEFQSKMYKTCVDLRRFSPSRQFEDCFVRMKFQILNTRRKTSEKNELSDWISIGFKWKKIRFC